MTRPSVPAAALLLALCCACAPNQASAPQASRDARQGEARGQASPSTTVWQVSPFALLVRGHFDGVVTAGEVRRHGDMGVGAADALDGEIAFVDGSVYQFMPGGRVQRPDPSLRIPFAIVTEWTGGASLRLPAGLQYAAPLLPDVDARLPTTNAFYALRLTGTWSVVRARTFRKQDRPYPPLGPAMADTFTFTNVQGTMVGFREPSYVDSLSVPDYHLHFVTADGTRGGHVNGFTARDVLLQYSERPHFTLHMPPGAAASGSPR
ncbi:MAG TPA: acetolactate decarboxylase [Longimicrobium sp.]|nr:acetolactate decarboxylase [Longimicrobium sp.]